MIIPRQGPGGKTNNFDFLRLLFALLVVYSHSFSLGPGSVATEPFVMLTRGQTTGGSIAVDCFFIMSGYLIAGSFQRSAGVGDYLMKRVRRIYPGFIAVSLFGVLIVLPSAGGTLIGANSATRVANVVLNVVTLREFSSTGAFRANPFPGGINGAVWTIRYEFLCYTGLAILGVCGILSRRKAVAGLSVSLVALGVWCRAQLPAPPDAWVMAFFGDPYLLARLLPLYLAGTTAYLYRDRVRYTPAGGILCAAVLFAGCFVPFAWGLVFPFAGTYLLLWAAFHPSVKLGRATRFGDLSYGTYLYAFPLQQFIVSLWGKPMNAYLLFGTVTPLVLLFALASWHCIERPFLSHRVAAKSFAYESPRVPAALTPEPT